MTTLHWDKHADGSYQGIIYPMFYIDKTREGLWRLIIFRKRDSSAKTLFFKKFLEAKLYAKKYLKSEEKKEIEISDYFKKHFCVTCVKECDENYKKRMECLLGFLWDEVETR